MNWSVDTPRRIGDLTVAAIVEFQVSVEATGPALTGMAKKRPLVIMQLSKNEVTAVDVNGHSYDADEIELLYPTAIAQVHALLTEAG